MLMNGVVEKTHKKTEVSIAKAADAINIPRMLIDILHEALDWLKSYYWEPQKKAIPYQSDGIGSLRKEIKYRLCELAFWLKIKHTKGSSSSLAKGKRTKHCEQLCGRNKFLSLMAGKPQSSKSAVLFDDWKPVTQEAMEYESGEHAISENTTGVHHIERLSDLFEWLVRNLKGLKPIGRGHSATVTEGSSIDTSLPKATLVKLLRKSLLVSSPSNNQLRDAALVLAHMIGNSSLVQKLNKLCFLEASNPTFDEENSPATSSESNPARLEDSIHQAAKKLEFVKLRRVKSNVLKTTDGDVGNNNRWVITKSWNSCPIGMLPCDVGSSGRLPVLDCDDDDKEDLKPLESKEQRALNEGMLKRGRDCDVELFNNLLVKKMRGSEGVCESDGKDDTLSEGVKGRLMIGGVWKKVEEEELFAIASAVRILV
ncbi:unnamed protein product [Camellia sinensis]